jgi:hypothetical protein
MSMGSQCMATVAARAAMVASSPWASGFIDDLQFNTNGGFPRRSVSMPATEVSHSLREALREAERKGTLEGGADEDEGGRNHEPDELEGVAEAAPSAEAPAPDGQAAVSPSTAESQSAASSSAPRTSDAAGEEGVGATSGTAAKSGSSFGGIFRSLLRSRSQGQPPMRASPLMPTDFIR